MTLVIQPQDYFEAQDARREPDPFPGSAELCLFCKTEFATPGFATFPKCRAKNQALDPNAPQPKPEPRRGTVKYPCPHCHYAAPTKRGLAIHIGKNHKQQPVEMCEGGCGPATHHDSEGTPVCAACYQNLLDEDAKTVEVAVKDGAVVKTSTVSGCVDYSELVKHVADRVVGPQATDLADTLVAVCWQSFEDAISLLHLHGATEDGVQLIRDRALLFADAMVKQEQVR